MRRALPLASCLIAASLLPILLPVLAEEPKLPDECKAFTRSQRARLAAVWGGYAWKHATPVSVLGFPDARTVLAGDERALTVWERASGREVKSWAAAGASVLSPDGKRVLVAGESLALLDLNGKALWTVEGRVQKARFAHDGKRVIALAATTATVYDEKGKELRTLSLDGGAEFATLSPDGKRALVGDGRRLALLDVAHGKKLGSLESDSPLTQVVWDADVLVTGAQDGKVRAWDPDKLAKPLWERSQKKGVLALAVASKKIAALSEDGAINVRDLNGNELSLLEDVGARAVALSPDGLTLASARHMVKLFGLETGKRIGSPDAGHEGPVLALALSKDLIHVLSGSTDHTARVWTLSAQRALHVLDQKEGAVTSVAFSPDDKEALTGSDDGSLELWDMKEGADLHRSKGPGPIGAVGFGPGVLRSVSTEGLLAFFERTKFERTFDAGTKGPAAPVLLSGKLALLANDKGSVKVWDVEAGREVRTLDGRLPVRALAASSSGKRALVGGRESLKVFDLASGTELRGLDVTGFTVSALAISADDKQGLVATEEGKVGLWDLETGKCVDVIDLGTAHDHARSVLFTPDGFLLGTGRGIVLRFEWVGA